MAGKGRNSKITEYRRYPWLNIGTILFGAIFLYMVITVILYLTAQHVTSYEVTSGSISGNYRYTALAIKSAEVIKADYSGYVTYYARSGARTGAGMTVCSIDEYSGQSRAAGEAQLGEEDYRELKTVMSSFSLNFSGSSFQSVYNFKSDLEGYILQARQKEGTYDGLLNQVSAPSSGFVSYTIDGMEGVTEAELSDSLFNRTKYDSINLRLNDKVRMGDDLYKLISGEDWYLYFPLSSQLATQLQDRTQIRFRFLKDDTTFSAGFSVLNVEGSYYGKITLHNSLVRYVSDRYLEIELLMDSKKGLKIPTSSIAEKGFCKIPAEYVTVNPDNSGEITLQRETFNKDGSSRVEYLTATVYDRQDNAYLVSRSLFRLGDYVQAVNSSRKHQIVEDDMVVIQGVYNINKGYAMFREVTVIDENEEFCIVEPYSPYGLAAHDFIVLDASTVSDDDIV